jgi:hypothetical protein
MFDALPTSIEYIRAGELRPLAVTTAMRSEAPRNTPAEIIDKLNKEINAGLADPVMKTRFADLGGTAVPDLPMLSEFVPGYEVSTFIGVGALTGSSADFGKLTAAETEKWGKVVKVAGIKAFSTG